MNANKKQEMFIWFGMVGSVRPTKLNDKIRIRVARVDMDERKIDFELISEH